MWRQRKKISFVAYFMGKSASLRENVSKWVECHSVEDQHGYKDALVSFHIVENIPHFPPSSNKKIRFLMQATFTYFARSRILKYD